MRTAALIALDGSIDWYCVPHFDSPSVFAAILDDGKGGRFKIAPLDDTVTSKQFYWPETNVLVTRFLSPDGVGQIIDYMPVADGSSGDALPLIRRVQVVRGTLTFRLECRPAFDYARETHTAVALRQRRRLPREVDEPGPLHARATRGRRPRRDGGVHAGRRGNRHVRAAAGRSRRRLPAAAVRGRAARPAGPDDWLLAPVVVEVHLHRPLARDGLPLGARPQAHDLRADRRHRRGADLRPARGRRRRRATGTTATPGSATRHSRSTRSCASASPRRRRSSSACSRRARTSSARTAACRSCTASTGGTS